MGSYTKALCNDGTQDVGDPTKAPCVNNGGIKSFFLSQGDIKNLLNNKGFPDTSKVTRTKVLCKDGTFGYDLSSSNAKYDNSKTCMNNGGRAENQKVTNEQAKAPAPPTKTGVSIYRKLAGAYNKNLIVAVVLVAGYFAYKKFKK